jgi:hypothetical protein
MYSGCLPNKRKLIDPVEIGSKGGRAPGGKPLDTRAAGIGPERGKGPVGCLLSASSGKASGQEGTGGKESKSGGAAGQARRTP